MKKIAIIPARSGSKGLIDKNIKLLNGKPLMCYSIEAAIKSNLFDVVHVSTDSKIYADIATKQGADVHFLRSNTNSCDSSSSWDAVREVLEKYKSEGKEFDVVCLLQPTSPLRDAIDIKKADSIFINGGFDSLVSVVEYEHPIEWAFEINENKISNFIFENKKDLARQKCKRVYRENGAIYFVMTHKVLSNRIYDNCGVYVMNSEKSVDIDNKNDFDFAEYLLRKD